MSSRAAGVVLFCISLASQAFAQLATPQPNASDWSLGPYAYDGAGNIKTIGTDTFTYDEFGRIKSATVAGQNQRYTYDRFGNLLTMQTGTTTIRLGVDANTNRLSTNTDALTGQAVNAWATYDAAGQLKQWNSTGGKFEYDGVGMVTSSRDIPGEPEKIYLYTPGDERIATVTLAAGKESSSEWTLRDDSGKVLRRFEKYRNANNQWEWRWRQDYIYLNGQLLASEVDIREKTLHFFLDHLGSPRLITGNGGVRVATHTYLPFGAEVTANNQDAERMKFTGHERDTSGLDYMHARYYSAGVGRFLSPDPFVGNPTVPASWNRYSYVLNRPVNAVDPTGACGEPAGFIGPQAPCDMSIDVVAKGPTFKEYLEGSAELSAQGWAQMESGAVEETFPQLDVAFPLALGVAQRAATAAVRSAIGTVAEGGSATAGGTVLSGHGGYRAVSGMTTLPEGTSLTVYARPGNEISNGLGNAIETGASLQPFRNEMWGARSYLPGSSVPNLTLYPPKGLALLGNPTTVNRATTLSTLLKPNMGNVKWAACLIGMPCQ